MTAAQPQSRFGDYFLIKKIATGGMAEIYLARTRTAQGPEKYVALKMIHPRYMEDGNFHRMIVEEAKIAVQLNHKNIGQVFDLGQVDGRYFLVMEFIDGYDLSRLHEATRGKEIRIPIDVAAFVGREVCAALGYAHSLRDRQGTDLELIHRDISPQNILISFDGDVKIIDFGIAKVSTQIQQTQVGVIKGKFYYMSPEQAGASDVDQRSDLFSLGICLWETLAGRSLFRRENGPTNPLAILHEIRTRPIPRISEVRPDCPPVLDHIVAKALSRDLTQRYRDAGEMQAALNRFLMSHAPSFDRGVVADSMAGAFDKVEVTKETERVTTKMADMMRRNDFQPSQASVIFALPDEPSIETAVFSTLGPMPGGAHELAKPVAGVAGASSGARPIVKSERPTHPVGMVSDQDLAMSETVFIRKDSIEEMRRAGAAPQVIADQAPEAQLLPDLPPADPQARTQSISSEAIAHAHQQYTERLKGSGTSSAEIDAVELTPPPKHVSAALPVAPLSQHPLFRWLVIGVLMLCVLTATVSLLLVRRTREYNRLLNERDRVLKTTVDVSDRADSP